jgi:hypothetical protein
VRVEVASSNLDIETKFISQVVPATDLEPGANRKIMVDIYPEIGTRIKVKIIGDVE